MTFPELLIWLPLLAGVICFFLKKGDSAKTFAILSSLIVLGVSVASLIYADEAKFASYNRVNYYWLKHIGNSFYLGLDGTGRILTFLTAISFPLIFISTQKNNYKNPGSFYGLMLLTMAGLMGVFVALDALVFYFFWELALIPVYFLCSKWGGEKRIQTTFKFFVYTFGGSLLMLIGIIYVYMHTPQRMFEDGSMSDHSFALQSFMSATLNPAEQQRLFWLFFAAFAIKMPVFPFHTWQPGTYDEAPTSVTMVLSGVMVKMGLFGVIRWLIPIFPAAVDTFANAVIILCIVGIIYASCIAIVQDNLKKLVAYSSIAHIGLMCAALFALNELSVQGAMIQLFSHGINIIGMWIVIDMLERQTSVKNISQLGGVAQKAPVLTIFLVIIALANIALPLTNAFVGEFLMFSGLFQANAWYAIAAGISIILAAVYTLRMIQKVFYGETNPITERVQDISFAEKISLGVIVVFIFLLGIMPQHIIEFTRQAVSTLIALKK
ncbi:MAG: NADH-quinone oxidoreductase subunit M [Gloeobacteraceae cyanobacterium ES-bin-316]|nr:NADH-quinone oxidoreductase subunit M [Ferruginibacter sp.]